jgi:acetolactate synthase-1/2/3 large subunit
MRPITKWAERVYEVRRIPEYVDLAFKHATSGKPGPVYLDLPGDVLFHSVPESDALLPRVKRDRTIGKPAASQDSIATITSLMEKAERPIVLSGTGILWSGAAPALQRFVEKAGIPFFTTPQGRGAVPEDHALAFLGARSAALREADLVLVVGTRLNYIFGFGSAPRFSEKAVIVQIDSDPEELSRSVTLDHGIVGDAAVVLDQITQAIDTELAARFAGWRKRLAGVNEAGRARQAALLASDQTPIHPLRLCSEIADFMDRDAVLVVDGQEILTYARQSIPTFVLGHRLNSGPFGTMGVGLPFGIGAKAAMPDSQVIVLHGDGSFGINAMELDASLRHQLPVLIVISLNGGWTADPEGKKAGSRLGFQRYDRMAEALGCHGEYVERPGDIRPALERAAAVVAGGRTALVNVVTDPAARAETTPFAFYRT